MKAQSPTSTSARRSALLTTSLALAVQMAACATASPPSQTIPQAFTEVQPPTPDPRVGLGPGWLDAEQAAWNMRLVSTTPPPEDFVGVTNSDLGFIGEYAIQGNYNGVLVWDVSNPMRPDLQRSYLCPASQSDVSVYENLLFVSGEGRGGRLDCGTQGVEEAVSHDRLRGIRIFDITDVTNPRYIANVQTCRGSHTHTVVRDENDPENVYIYVSGSSSVRPAEELAGCSGLSPEEDPNTALFRIEVIRVPLDDPGSARIVSSPRIFEDLDAPPRHADPVADTAGRGARRAARGLGPPTPPTGPTQCHDITVYPAIDFAGGACGGYGLLLDISDVTNPRRVYAAADSNFSYWHSATFSNDGSKVLFTDEWGGGGAPRCRDTDKYEWGADAIFVRNGNDLEFKSYFKMPAPQTIYENCVAHNGSLIPIPGRDVMVQGWYQGGVDVFDWTDPEHPIEIAYFDRGPMDTTRMRSAGSWSIYWYNGYIYSSEIARGLDVFELTPSPFLTENEIEAARTVQLDYFNAQEQPRYVWPPSFALARAYVDQLERSGGLAANRVAEVRSTLDDAERQSGQARSRTLNGLAGALDSDGRGSSDRAKVRMLAGAVRELAGAM